jgi:peptide/nickel transport system permease protein
MWQYIVKRLLLMIPTLIGAALVIFLLMNIIPGDVALLIIGGDQGGDINPRELAKLRTQLGLDRPLYEQFLTWLWSVVRLDFAPWRLSGRIPGWTMWCASSVSAAWPFRHSGQGL